MWDITVIPKTRHLSPTPKMVYAFAVAVLLVASKLMQMLCYPSAKYTFLIGPSISVLNLSAIHGSKGEHMRQLFLYCFYIYVRKYRTVRVIVRLTSEFQKAYWCIIGMSKQRN